ncbi:MAG: DegV family protein [Peptococcaceae bacterium]|nr:DegV family protein [Peptococcaceae bacterium]
MNKIAIVTDSTADIPNHLVQDLNIKVIPLTVHYGGKSYLDRVDISNEDFYRYIATAKTLPTTSQPSPAQYVDVYRACKAEGATKILSIHISSEMSGTSQGAKMAADLVKDEIDVEVIDSRTVTMGLGLQVVTIAQYIRQNPEVEWEALLARIETIKKNTRILFLLDTLDNLQKGGRIGKASYLVGSVLNIKPILIVEDGVIAPYEKVRGRKFEKTVNHLVDTICGVIDPEKPLYCDLGFNNAEYLEIFKNKLLPALDSKRKAPTTNVGDFQIGSVVTTHIGLGAFGIAYYQL